MKILQLTSHFRPNVGGVETHLDDLVKGLVSRNYCVSVLTYCPLITKAKWKILERSKNLTIFRIPWFPGLFYKFVNNPLIEFLYLLPGLFVAAPFIIYITKPDVIHSHGLVAGFVGVFWGKFFRKRVITTTHSIYNFPSGQITNIIGGFYTKFSKWIYSNSNIVLTLSKQSAGEIENLGVEKKKISTFTYWIDLNKFKPINNKQGLASFAGKQKAKKEVGWGNKFVVLFVGRLVEEKGIFVLLDAAKMWNKDITLAIIGTGPLEESIKYQVSSIKNIIFIGKVDNEKLPKYYNASDLLIVPSIHEEGFGRVILESLACGTPVIGSNRGAIPEAIDVSVGKLIDITQGNIKDAVENFFNNPNKLNILAKNTRTYAEKRYSDNNIKILTNVYTN